MDDGDFQRIETIVDQAKALSPTSEHNSSARRAMATSHSTSGRARLGQDTPELSIELMESIALEAVADRPISQITRDDPDQSPWRFQRASAGHTL